MIRYHRFTATIQFDDRIVGGIPVVPEGADRHDTYEAWARGQKVEDAPGYTETLPEALADDPDMPVAVATDEIEGLATGFRSDDQGLYVEARQVKAMLRESAQRLGLIKTTRGVRQVLQHDLHVRAVDGSQKIRLGVTEPTGRDQRPISVVTRQGPRTTIKRFDYVSQPSFTFVVLLLADGIGDGLLDEGKLRDMLEFGGMIGLGADRSQGEGTFRLNELTPQE